MSTHAGDKLLSPFISNPKFVCSQDIFILGVYTIFGRHMPTRQPSDRLQHCCACVSPAIFAVGWRLCVEHVILSRRDVWYAACTAEYRQRKCRAWHRDSRQGRKSQPIVVNFVGWLMHAQCFILPHSVVQTKSHFTQWA